MIKLPDLPYDQDALSPHIPKSLLEFHYDKHHKAYVDNLNKLIKDTKYEDKDLEYIIAESSGPIFNNAAQVFNHAVFWNSMTPDYTDPEGPLEAAINKSFGSLDEFKEKWKSAGTQLFGSGWIWLVQEGVDLVITPTKDAKLPNEGMPLLVMDVWEHAYYPRYQNRRPEYIDAFLKVINWKFAAENYDE